MTLTLRFWGVRGSIASPGASTARYGGNTPCASLEAPDGSLLVFDAGTGLRALGDALAARDAAVDTQIAITHAHWDHIQGLPFFAPLYDARTRVVVRGPRPDGRALADVVRAQMDGPVFPVPFDALPATVTFAGVDDAWRWGDYEVSASAVRHPGGAVAYRVARGAGNIGSGAVVYVSDNELGDGSGPDDGAATDALDDFARDADVLVHDSMYTEAEYARHRGWGHSSHEQAVALALRAGVRTLVLYHHHPARDDDALDAALARCRARVRDAGSTIRVVAASEGLALDV